MTEVIKDQGGEETSTEYFAALLTTLEATDTEDGLSAIVSLLSMVIKTVPQEVIRSRFSKVGYCDPGFRFYNEAVSALGGITGPG